MDIILNLIFNNRKFFFLNAQLGNVRRFCSLPFLPEAITSVDRLDYNKELRSAAQQRYLTPLISH